MHDSHIHLTMEPLKSNLQEVIDTFTSNGGKYILTQGTDTSCLEENIEISKKYPNIIQAAIGIHPTFFEEITTRKNLNEDIYTISQKEINKFEEIFRKNIKEISAVGECGLDYYQFFFDESYSKDTVEQLKEIQKIALRKQLQIAKEFSLPLSIHARENVDKNECMKDILRIIVEEGKGTLRGSFHSYTGDVSFLNDILDLGFYVGFNGIITYNSGENVRDILKKTPVERILFETDGPFLPPQSVRKNNSIKEKFAQPNDITEIINTASEVLNLNPKYLEEISDENYKYLFL